MKSYLLLSCFALALGECEADLQGKIEHLRSENCIANDVNCGNSMLCAAIQESPVNIDLVAQLISKEGSDPYSECQNSLCIVDMAVKENNKDLIKALCVNDPPEKFSLNANVVRTLGLKATAADLEMLFKRKLIDRVTSEMLCMNDTEDHNIIIAEMGDQITEYFVTLAKHADNDAIKAVLHAKPELHFDLQRIYAEILAKRSPKEDQQH